MKLGSVEPGLSDFQISALERMGPLSLWPERHFYFGGVNAVQLTAAGDVVAHADPRRGGATRVL